MDFNKTSLTILHVSDVHTSLDKVDELHQWMIRNERKVDLVLLSGDIADMPMDYGYDESDTAKKFKESYYEDLFKVVEAIAKINERVYYIPGNHDAPRAFTVDGKTEPPCNVHLRCLPIARDLYVAGLGGSVPGYKDGQQCWNSFPYKTQEEMGADLDKLTDTMRGFHPAQFILMTHNGPSESSTTVVTDDPYHPILSGSTSLHQWLCKQEAQTSVVVNIHGHTHPGFGEAQIGGISILNPGSLMENRFAIYLLSQNTGHWSVDSVQRVYLK